MLPVSYAFILVAALVFIGYALKVSFHRTRITDIIPLMLIGILIGPIFHVVGTGPDSTVQILLPYFEALAICIVIFDAGLGMNLNDMKTVLSFAIKFTFSISIAEGIIVGVLLYYIMHWAFLLCLVVGFAMAGPSTVGVPIWLRFTKINKKLKSILLFESVATDVVQLIIPIMLLNAYISGSFSISHTLLLILITAAVSIVLGIVFSVLWIMVLHHLKHLTTRFSWVLTITFVLLIYGFAASLNMSGAIAVFIFGMMIANVEKIPQLGRFMPFLRKQVIHIKSYQREVTFFIATFFFVFLGIIFTISAVTMYIIWAAVLSTLVFFVLRKMRPMYLKKYFDPEHVKSEKTYLQYDIARGIEPVIIAALPLALGINIPGFIEYAFVTILLTNVFASFGTGLYTYRLRKENANRPQVSVSEHVRRTYLNGFYRKRREA